MPKLTIAIPPPNAPIIDKSYALVISRANSEMFERNFHIWHERAPIKLNRMKLLDQMLCEISRLESAAELAFINNRNFSAPNPIDKLTELNLLGDRRLKAAEEFNSLKAEILSHRFD